MKGLNEVRNPFHIWGKCKFWNKEMENIEGENLLEKCMCNSKFDMSFDKMDHIFSLYLNQMAPP